MMVTNDSCHLLGNGHDNFQPNSANLGVGPVGEHQVMKLDVQLFLHFGFVVGGIFSGFDDSLTVYFPRGSNPTSGDSSILIDRGPTWTIISNLKGAGTVKSNSI